jgi:hypothetical protein
MGHTQRRSVVATVRRVHPRAVVTTDEPRDLLGSRLVCDRRTGRRDHDRQRTPGVERAVDESGQVMRERIALPGAVARRSLGGEEVLVDHTQLDREPIVDAVQVGALRVGEPARVALEARREALEPSIERREQRVDRALAEVTR